MSVKLMSAIFETEMRDLDYEKDGEPHKTKASTAKLVLLALADHANDYGESTYPGYDKLEIKTALSRQGLADTFQALQQNGIISVDVRGSRLGTNSYTINIKSFPPMYKEIESLAEVVKPLDSAKSSHLTQASQATRLKPSVKHTKQPSVKKEKPDFQNIKPSQYKSIPELKTFMDATGWIPGSFVLETVYDFVLAGLTAEQIKGAFTEWTARGYKPANVQGYLTWARDGIPPMYTKRDYNKKQTKPQATPESYTPEEIQQLQNSVDWSVT